MLCVGQIGFECLIRGIGEEQCTNSVVVGGGRIMRSVGLSECSGVVLDGLRRGGQIDLGLEELRVQGVDFQILGREVVAIFLASLLCLFHGVLVKIEFRLRDGLGGFGARVEHCEECRKKCHCLERFCGEMAGMRCGCSRIRKM